MPTYAPLQHKRPVVQRKSSSTKRRSKGKRRATRSFELWRWPGGLAHKMETAFGHDFSQVKIHPASSEALALQTAAFTRGNEIFA